MNYNVLKPSELKFLVKCSAIKNYRWKGFLIGGSFPKMLFESTVNNQEVVGKIVSLRSEGELKIWPKLLHPNLNPLLEVLCLDNNKILISPVGKCIRNFIYDSSFIENPQCFERKKSYVKDVLSGLSYLHQNSICILSINDTNVEICTYEDKAVLCDFSCAVARKKVTKSLLPPSALYLPPEVQNAANDDVFNGMLIDMWFCGQLFLQIFTQHRLPGCGDAKNSLQYVSSELLSKANVGACLQDTAASDLKKFLRKFLSQNPNLRTSAKGAIKAPFLQTSHHRLDEIARRFWEVGANPSCQMRDSFHEDPLANSEISSVCSEIDVSAVSENDSLAANHTSHSVGKAQIARTKSEPGGQFYHEQSSSLGLPGNASFPSLFKRNNSLHSLKSFDEGDAVLDTAMLEDIFPSESRGECNSDAGVIQKELSRGKEYGENLFDAFLTEWDPYYLATNQQVDSAAKQEEKLVADQSLSSSCASSLSRISPRKSSNYRLNERNAASENCRKYSTKSHEIGCRDFQDFGDDYSDWESPRPRSCVKPSHRASTKSACTSTTDFAKLATEISPSSPSLNRTESRPTDGVQSCRASEASDGIGTASESKKVEILLEGVEYDDEVTTGADEKKREGRRRSRSENRKWYHFCIGFRRKRKRANTVK